MCRDLRKCRVKAKQDFCYYVLLQDFLKHVECSYMLPNTPNTDYNMRYFPNLFDHKIFGSLCIDRKVFCGTPDWAKVLKQNWGKVHYSQGPWKNHIRSSVTRLQWFYGKCCRTWNLSFNLNSLSLLKCWITYIHPSFVAA